MAVDRLKRFPIPVKTASQTGISVAGNFGNAFVNLTVSDAEEKIVTGYIVSNTTSVTVAQIYFSSDTQITVRLINLSSATAGANLTVYYK